jgi:hypothetical protein
MGESDDAFGREGEQGEMMARKAKKVVEARKRLQELTPAELTEVSGGGMPFPNPFPFHHHHHHHHHRHHHHRHFPFI